MENTTTKNISSRSYMIGEYSDLYKSMHGIRPRWMDWDAYSDEELTAELKDLIAEGDRQFEAEELQARLEDAAFESELKLMLDKGARDRVQALAWMLDADMVDFNDNQNVEFWIYSQGVTFDCQQQIMKMIKELRS